MTSVRVKQFPTWKDLQKVIFIENLEVKVDILVLVVF